MSENRVRRQGLGLSTSRRSVLKYAAGGSVAAIGSIAVPGSISAMVQARKAPFLSQGTEVSGKLKVLMYGEATADESLHTAFKAAYPAVELEVVGIPGGTWATFADAVSTRVAGGESYDVVMIATEGQRLFAARGLVDPIDDLLERDAGILADYFADVDPNLVNWCKTLSSPDGQTYYLPGDFNTVGVWVNLDLFAAAGLPEPDGEWTWDQFKEAALALTKPGEVYGAIVEAGQFAGVMPWLLTNGATALNADWTEATINSPAAIEAAQFARSFVAEGISPEPGGEFDVWTSVAQGKLGMVFSGKWPTPAVVELEFLDHVKVVKSPHKVGPGSPVGWKSFPIMKGAKNREAAWAFSRFTSSPDASQFVLYETPARRSIATSPEYLARSPKGAEIMYEALAYATPVAGTAKGSTIQQDIEDTWEQILIGNLEAEPALNDLNAKMQNNL